MLALKDSTLIKIVKGMEHMNTSITQDSLELTVPTALKWDQLLPGTCKQPYEEGTGHFSDFFLFKTEDACI